jgi:hypothetical protein
LTLERIARLTVRAMVTGFPIDAARRILGAWLAVTKRVTAAPTGLRITGLTLANSTATLVIGIATLTGDSTLAARRIRVAWVALTKVTAAPTDFTTGPAPAKPPRATFLLGTATLTGDSTLAALIILRALLALTLCITAAITGVTTSAHLRLGVVCQREDAKRSA